MTTHASPPRRTYGLRRPHLGLHVLSLIAPMTGWISRPVMGPAMLRMGRSCASAPNSTKIGFTAVWVRPKLNWTPKKPRFIQAMLPELIRGRRSSSVSSLTFSWSSAVPVATIQAASRRCESCHKISDDTGRIGQEQLLTRSPGTVDHNRCLHSIQDG